GTVAGLAEWFRTGNLLLFAVPCAVYSLAGFRQRDRRGFCLPAGALIAWVGIAALAELAAPSSVNKIVVNLWDCRVDLGCEMGRQVEEGQTQVEVESALGPPVTVEYPDGSRFRQTMLGYTLVPETTEIYMDYVNRCSRGRSTLSYCWE